MSLQLQKAGEVIAPNSVHLDASNFDHQAEDAEGESHEAVWLLSGSFWVS